MSNNVTTLSLNPSLPAKKDTPQELQLANEQIIAQTTPLSPQETKENTESKQDSTQTPQDMQKQRFINSYTQAKKAQEFLNSLSSFVAGNPNLDKQLQQRIYSHILTYGDVDNEFSDYMKDSKYYQNLKQEAELRKEIFSTKDYKNLSDKAKAYMSDEYGAWNKVFDIFKSDQEKKDYFTQREQGNQNLKQEVLTDISILTENDPTSKALAKLVSSDEANLKDAKRLADEATQIVKARGYDYAGISKKDGNVYVFKDGKAYSTNNHAFFDNFSRWLDSNLTSVATAPIGLPRLFAANTIGRVLGAGAYNALGGGIDYYFNRKRLGLDANINGALKVAGNDFAMGVALQGAGEAILKGAQKGIQHKQQIAKGLNTAKDKVVDLGRKVWNNEDAAINSKLNKFNKDEINKNYEAFKNFQSETKIKDDLRPTGIVGKAMDTLDKFSPVSARSETLDKYASALFSNKELAEEMAGKASAEHAQILNKLLSHQEANLSKLSKDFEKQVIKEYANTGKIDLNTIPAVYKDVVDSIEKEVKNNYALSIKDLNKNLSDVDFKDSILNSYMQITDKALQDLGVDNNLSKLLINDTKNIENAQKVSLNEAIELRKRLNDTIRSYEKSPSELRKFNANNMLKEAKDSIDNAIKNALDSKVANGYLDKVTANNLFENFKIANVKYADIKKKLKDDFAKAITDGLNEKKIKSSLSQEEWKKRVLNTNWADSIKGLENTIFKDFNPKMSENMQFLFIFRAVDSNIKGTSGNKSINFEKILQDFSKLEKLQLNPNVYPSLELLKDYIKLYRFSDILMGAKGLKSGTGDGALSNSLKGRAEVMLNNRLFKKILAKVPVFGKDAALINGMLKSIENLKYPKEITLEMLRIFKDVDAKNLAKGKKLVDNPLDSTQKATTQDIAQVMNIDKNPNVALRLADENTINDIVEFSKIIEKPQETYIKKQQKDVTKANLDNAQAFDKSNFFTHFENAKIVSPKGQDIAIKEAFYKEFANTKDLKDLFKYDANGANFTMQINGNTYIYRVNKDGYHGIFDTTQPKTYTELKTLENSSNEMQQSLENIKKQTAEAKKQEILERIEAKKQDSIESNALKSLENAPQKGRDMPLLGKENFNIETLKWILENNKKVAIDKLDSNIAKEMGFKYPNDVKRTIQKSEINHTLKRHGETSNLATKSDQKPVTLQDINKWIEYSDNADKRAFGKDDLNQDVIFSGKQINGYYVVVESIRKKHNELAFKTMYFEKGNIENNPIFKRDSNATSGYEPDANSFVSKGNNTIDSKILQDIESKKGLLDSAKEKYQRALQNANKTQKDFYERQINNLEKSIFELEKASGMRLESDKFQKASPLAQTKTHTIDNRNNYEIYTQDGDKFILSDTQLQKVRHIFDIDLLTDIKPIHLKGNRETLKKYIDNKEIILDLPKYLESSRRDERNNLAGLRNALYDFDLAIKDINNAIILYKDNASVKLLRNEYDKYIAKGDAPLLKDIESKIRNGAEVIYSNIDSIKSTYNVESNATKKGNEIPFTKIKDTSIQTENMKEPIKAEYVVVNKDDIHPNFNAESGYQNRLQKQESVIKNIANSFKASKMINQEGGFAGLPIIDSKGYVIAGNHRAQGLKTINNQGFIDYKNAIKEKFNIDLKDNELVVRRVDSNVDKEILHNLAQKSNEGQENNIGELVYTQYGKYANKAKNIKEIQGETLEDIKLEINHKLGGRTQGDVFNTNLAFLVSQVSDVKTFRHALSALGRHNDSLTLIGMMVDNAGSFYKLNKEFPEVSTNKYIIDATQALANYTHNDIDKSLKEAATFMESFITSSNKENVENFAKQLGGNVYDRFKGQIFSAAIKRMSVNNANPSEVLFERIKQFRDFAEDLKEDKLFNQGRKPNDYDFLSFILSSHSNDINNKIRFFLDLFNTREQLRNGDITLDSIKEANKRKWIDRIIQADEAEARRLQDSKDMIESNLDSMQKGENLNKKQWKQVDSAKIAHTATQEEFDDFIAKAWSNDKEQYKLMPNAIKVAEINKKLQKALGLTKGDTYLTKSQAIHTRESRKANYNQDISLEDYAKIPKVIARANEAYVDTETRFLIPFESSKTIKNINAIVLESNSDGNLLITGKRININDLNQYKRVKVAEGGS